MAQAHGFIAHDYFVRVLAGVLVVYVLCWYQLIDGTWELQAWPIFLATLRARL